MTPDTFPARLFSLETFGIKLGLENIRHLCEALGHPERSFLALHIAGTNGKGSVTAMVHAALVAAGIHAGRYTSPHLVDLRERFMVGESLVDEGVMEGVATRVLDLADRLQRDGILPAPPTFFEATTAMAFEIFKQSRVEVAVIEVGLGGRFDATNVLEAPVGAITSIARDHEQYLGHTLDRIAFEKAGIIKPGMNVVCGALPDEALDVVRRVAMDRGATLVEAARATKIHSHMERGRARITIDTEVERYGPLLLGLRGEHQIGNAAVAACVLEAARKRGVQLSASAIAEGFERVTWPARLELLHLSDGSAALLDAAHNPQGARALREYLAAWHPERPALVVGVMGDKDADGILRELLPVTSSVFATAADTPRSMPASELASRVKALDGAKSVVECADAADAVTAALAASRTICVAGSIFLVGAIRHHLAPRRSGL